MAGDSGTVTPYVTFSLRFFQAGGSDFFVCLEIRIRVREGSRPPFTYPSPPLAVQCSVLMFGPPSVVSQVSPCQRLEGSLGECRGEGKQTVLSEPTRGSPFLAALVFSQHIDQVTILPLSTVHPIDRNPPPRSWSPLKTNHRVNKQASATRPFCPHDRQH